MPTPIDGGQGKAQGAAQTRPTPAVNLFDSSSYQAKEPVQMPDGTTLSLPGLSGDEAAQAQSLFGQIPQEHHAALNAASTKLGVALMAQGIAGSNIATHSKIGSPAGASTITVNQASPDVAGAVNNARTVYANAKTGANAGTYGSQTGATDYDNTVQAVAYMGVLGIQNEMGSYAQGMQATQADKNNLRADQNELNTAIASWPDDGSTQTFTYHETNAQGTLILKTADMTKDQAKAALGNVQGALTSYQDQTQLQVIQLQNMQQNYQTGLTTISNLLKAAYDTTKNTVGNIHY